MGGIARKRFEEPDDTRALERGKGSVVNLAGSPASHSGMGTVTLEAGERPRPLRKPWAREPVTEGATMAHSAQELVARARSRIRNLSVSEFAKELENGGVMLVDLREPDEVLGDGAIPGAVHVPRGVLEFWADPASPHHHEGFDPARRTLLYCASGNRSALAVRALQGLGYTDVAHLDGGLKAWTEHGRPVTRRA